MNICFVYQNYPIDGNYDSGIGRYIFELANKLKINNKVIIVTLSDSKRIIKSKNLTIYALQKNTFVNNRSLMFIYHILQIAIALPRIIKQEKVELLEFANWESEGLIFTTLLNSFYKIPIVIRLHTPSVIINKFVGHNKYFSEKLKEFCEKIFVSQKANYLTSSTHYNISECKKVYNLGKKVAVIPLGINPKRVLTHKQISLSRKLSVLYVGRLEERKGIDILIKAIPTILIKNENITFHIVGQENNNHKWITDLRNSIPYKFLNNVNFLGYISDPNTLEKIYQNSDICVVPSRYESFGLVVLDGLNYQKAVIASKVGGIPEIINNNSGILIKPTPKNLSKSILKLSRNRSLMLRISQNGKSLIKSKFNSHIMASNTLKYYTLLHEAKL